MEVLPVEKKIEELNHRWHDQPLDLTTVRFNASEKELSFKVCLNTGRLEKIFNLGFIWLNKNKISKGRMVFNKVKSFALEIAGGEVELIVNEITQFEDKMIISGNAGDILIFGNEIQLNDIADEQFDHFQMELFLLFFDISWKKKSKT